MEKDYVKEIFQMLKYFKYENNKNYTLNHASLFIKETYYEISGLAPSIWLHISKEYLHVDKFIRTLPSLGIRECPISVASLYDKEIQVLHEILTKCLKQDIQDKLIEQHYKKIISGEFVPNEMNSKYWK